MNRRALCLSIAIVALCTMTTRVGVAQAPPAGDGKFNGRWEVSIKPPTGASGGPSEMGFFIVEISGSDAKPVLRLIDSLGAPALTASVGAASVEGDQVKFTVEMIAQKLTFTGKRAGAELDGTAIAASDPTAVPWVGRITTKDKLPSLTGQLPEPSADQKAYTAAMLKPAVERVLALKQFIADFPTSSFKDQALLSIATAPAGTVERRAGLQAFIADNPNSRLREQAEFQLTSAYLNPNERRAAEDKFLSERPKSIYAGSIYRSWLDRAATQKPADEATLKLAIDGMMATVPTGTSPAVANQRASVENTIADRLMANDVMLDRALPLIEDAVASTEQIDKQTRTIYITTLGQVLFKLKRYDDAGRELKRAVQVSGGDADGETQLFLGKYYEVMKDEDAALAAYLKALEMGSPLDTKVSLERLYIKKHGSLATLTAKLDAAYLAKPRGFEPGHFTRPASTAPARVVLGELFTGADCGPCVASDMAFDGLVERFGHDTLAVLVYHLHIPGPDPMTNTDTEERAKYYGVNATPTVFFDGIEKEIGGGGATQAGASFNGYKGKVETRVTKDPLAELTGFSATKRGQTMTVKGQAALSAAAAGRAGHTSVHVAIVEDSIRYVGSNGVRFHNLVVRKLLGSPAGTPIATAGAKVTIDGAFDLASFTTTQEAYLDKYEKDRLARTNLAFKFKEHVDQPDAAKLLVVAFVQDDQTKEILQAIVINPK